MSQIPPVSGRGRRLHSDLSYFRREFLLLCLEGLARLRTSLGLLDSELSDLLHFCFQVAFLTTFSLLLYRLGLGRNQFAAPDCLCLLFVRDGCLEAFCRVFGHRQQFLVFLSIGLVHLMLDLSHTLCFFDPELLPFLVPAPLVNLAFSQACQLAQLRDRFFAPVGVVVETSLQVAELVA